MAENMQLASAAAELREAVERGDVDADALDAMAVAGMVPEGVCERLMAYKRAYDAQPESEKDTDSRGHTIYWAEDTKYWEIMVQKHVPQGINRAVRQDNLGWINYCLGKLSRSSNEDWLQMKKIEAWLDKPGRLIVWGGQMGDGKTSAALRMVEFYRLMYPQTKVASNIPSWREKDQMVGGVEELEEWINNTDGRKTVVLDEMSSKATGYNDLALQMSEMVRKMRHKGVKLMQVIGHRVEADIHPSIREIADIAKKPELTRVDVYDSVGQSDASMSFGIEDTSYKYDDEEGETPWAWLEEEEFDYEAAAQKAAVETYNHSDDLTQTDVADMFTEAGFEMSASTISRKMREMV